MDSCPLRQTRRHCRVVRSTSGYVRHEGPDGEAIEVRGGADHRAASAGGLVPAAEVRRKHGIDGAIGYVRDAEFLGLHVAEAEQFAAPEKENAEPKRFAADALLDDARRRGSARKW
jgi:hypothetical protein